MIAPIIYRTAYCILSKPFRKVAKRLTRIIIIKKITIVRIAFIVLAVGTKPTIEILAYIINPRINSYNGAKKPSSNAVMSLLSQCGKSLKLTLCSFIYVPQSENALSSQTISTGNIPLILPTPGTAGQSMMPQTALNNQGYTVGMLGLSTPQQLAINTNTVQASSNNAPWYTYIPGYLASTVGNLANALINPPGYTPGGAPLAGGQFLYNYPSPYTRRYKYFC